MTSRVINPKIQDESPQPIWEGIDFTELAGRIFPVENRQKPTLPEKNNLWRVACDTVATLAREGRAQAEVKRLVARYLVKFGPRLAASEKALFRGLERRVARHAIGESVADRRAQAAKARRAPKLCQA